jgi:hypothetical protein
MMRLGWGLPKMAVSVLFRRWQVLPLPRVVFLEELAGAPHRAPLDAASSAVIHSAAAASNAQECATAFRECAGKVRTPIDRRRTVGN